MKVMYPSRRHRSFKTYELPGCRCGSLFQGPGADAIHIVSQLNAANKPLANLLSGLVTDDLESDPFVYENWSHHLTTVPSFSQVYTLLPSKAHSRFSISMAASNGFMPTPLTAHHDDPSPHSRKRPGSPPLTPAGKRHRSIEMLYLEDSMSHSAGMSNCTIEKFTIYFIFV